jgi:5-methylcytosine-specific restriction endonuclease McrA
VKPLDAFHRRSGRAGGRQSKCAECAKELSKAHREANPEYYRAKSKEWYAAHPGYKTEWAKANRDRHLEHRSRSRTKLAGGKVVEAVDRWKLWQAYKGRCGICFEPVAYEEFHIDHKVPLARGGEHSYANTRPTHRVCNQRKSLKDRRSA